MHTSLFTGFLLLAFAGTAVSQEGRSSRLERIRPSNDGTHFVGQESGRRFVVWGVNYDHDDVGRLLEDYWEKDWDKVIADFRAMRGLGANVVRVHLQFAKFMEAADRTNATNLKRFEKLVALAEATGLYLDVTGLGCYHRTDVPAWYDALDEAGRWKSQAVFWRAIATVCRDRPAIFCYDLMNEPILPGAKPEKEWLGAEFGGKHFVQRIALDLAGRSREEVAKLWVKQLAAAIRDVDGRAMLTVGEIPWAHVFKGAKPLFHAPGVGDPLDFVSVHFYPKKDEVAGALAALKVYEHGKPLVVEEIFPLACSIEEVGQFIDGSRPYCDGWVSFYWGKTIAENEKAGDLKGAIVSQWLRWFRDRAPGWTQLASLPDAEGFAGSFAGTSGGALVVAGGANFPGRKPWEGGTKVWTDAVYVLEKPDGPWRIAGKLPRPLGYGVSATHDGGMVVVGSSDANRHYSDAFRIEWKNGALTTTALPALPRPIANACGALVGSRLYIAGGLESPQSVSPLKSLYSLDLVDRAATWQVHEPIPGRGRMLAMAAGHDGALWIAGGVDLVNGRDAKVAREYLKDVYRFDPTRGWQRLADLPTELAAAATFADAHGVAILGGDDGRQTATPPLQHPGFSTAVLRYFESDKTWRATETLTAPRVTVPCVRWGERWVVPGGEVRPGVRSPEVWSRRADQK